MALLSKSWKQFISQHYAWSSLPQLKEHTKDYSRADFTLFCLNFSELTGIEISETLAELIKEESLEFLSTARSLGSLKLTQEHALPILLSRPILLQKLRSLTLELSTYELGDTAHCLLSSAFLLNLSSLQQLHISITDYSHKEKLPQNRKMKLSLKSLNALIDLTLKFSYYWKRLSDTTTPKLCPRDFPPSLKSLHLQGDCLQFMPLSISSLPNLTSLQFGQFISHHQSTQSLSKTVQDLKIRFYSSQIGPYLQNLHSLQIAHTPENLEIKGLKRLKTLILRRAEADIELQNLPNLQMLQIHKFKLHLKSGIGEQAISLTEQQVSLNGLLYTLEVELFQFEKVWLGECIPNYTGLKTRIFNHLDISSVQKGVQSLQLQTLAIQELTLSFTNLRYLEITSQGIQGKLQSLLLQTPSLRYVSVILAFTRDLKLVFSCHLQVLKIICGQLYLGGAGTIETLSLEVQRVMELEFKTMITTVKEIRAIQRSELQPLFMQILPWNSLIKLSFLFGFHSRSLSLIQSGAPNLRQIVLSGRSKDVTVQYSSKLRLLDITHLDLQEIKCVKGRHSDKLKVTGQGHQIGMGGGCIVDFKAPRKVKWIKK